LIDGARTGAKKLAELNNFLSNPFVQDGLEVLRQSGLNGMVLGSQVKKDIESGKIPADMVARLKDNSFRTGDVAFLLGYLRDLAGGTLELNLDSDAARRLIAKVDLPAEVKAETIRGLQLGPGDKLILRFSGDPLYDAGAVSLDFNKELELSISGIGDPNATRLTFEAEGGTATEMMFSGWNLEATNNKTVDGVLSFLAKILMAPFLLIASLFGEAKGARVELEDNEDGSTSLTAEAFGANLANERLTKPTEPEPEDDEPGPP